MADLRIVKTRKALAHALLALVGEKPFAELSIGEIVQRAGIGYATFFRHYPDKDALLADVADGMIFELLAQIAPALLQEDTVAASVALCRYVGEHRAICRALLAGGAEASVRRHILARALVGAEASGLAPVAGLPADLAIGHAVGATLGLLAWWLNHEGAYDAEAMGAIIDHLVIAPTRTRPALEPAHDKSS